MKKTPSDIRLKSTACSRKNSSNSRQGGEPQATTRRVLFFPDGARKPANPPLGGPRFLNTPEPAVPNISDPRLRVVIQLVHLFRASGGHY